jgi:O-antigen ligase
MARSHPVLGNGVGTFETVFPAYMSHVSDLHWTHAHDDFAEVLAETGLVGGALLLWGLVLFFRRAFLHLPARLRADWSWIPIGAAVGAVGLLCHSLVDFNLRLPANAAWFVVCVAVATHPGSWPDRPTRVARVSVPERNEDFIN